MNASLSTLPATPESSPAHGAYDPMSGCEYHEIRSRGGVDHLTVTSWTHHGTSWVAATGTLDAATTPTLMAALTLVCARTGAGVVLNLTGLNRLDAVAMGLIAIEQQRLAAQGFNLTTIAPLGALRRARPPARRAPHPVRRPHPLEHEFAALGP